MGGLHIFYLNMVLVCLIIIADHRVRYLADESDPSRLHLRGELLAQALVEGDEESPPNDVVVLLLNLIVDVPPPQLSEFC